MKPNKNLQNYEKSIKICITKIKLKLTKPLKTQKYLLAFQYVLFFLVEMMNSCSVSSFHMPSYNFVLCLSFEFGGVDAH